MKQVQVPYHTPQADVTLMVGLAIDLVMSHTLLKTVRLVVILITGLDQKVEVLIMDPEAIQLMGKALLVE